MFLHSFEWKLVLKYNYIAIIAIWPGEFKIWIFDEVALRMFQFEIWHIAIGTSSLKPKNFVKFLMALIKHNHRQVLNCVGTTK